MTNPLPDIDAIPPIRDYEGLRKALAAARRARGMSQLGLDYVAGLASGHTGKLECGTKGFGALSLGLVLHALDIALVVRPAERSISPVASEIARRNMQIHEAQKKKMRRIQASYAAHKAMTPMHRRERARIAAKARWIAVRKARREPENHPTPGTFAAGKRMQEGQ